MASSVTHYFRLLISQQIRVYRTGEKKHKCSCRRYTASTLILSSNKKKDSLEKYIYVYIYIYIVAYLRSRDYATVEEAVFSPCLVEPSRAEPSRAVMSRVSPHIASPGNSYKHFNDERKGKCNVTASAVTSRVSTVRQQLKRFPRVRSRVYRRDWS
jgi:hypothetical protein